MDQCLHGHKIHTHTHSTPCQVYLAGHQAPMVNLQLLDEMIATRSEMAETVGCGSYSEYKAIGASLGQDPQGVDTAGHAWPLNQIVYLGFALDCQPD